RKMDIETVKISYNLNLIKEKAKKNKKTIKNMKSVTYGFEISGDEVGKYTLEFDLGDVKINERLQEETDCTLELSDKNFKKLVNGNLNATSAFMMGKIKIK